MMQFGVLLWGTVVERPYVYLFFGCFLISSVFHFGWRDCLVWIGLTFSIGFACEYSSTRNGFPFGVFRYFDQMRGRELWISNVPFWDPLSFVFLAYYALIVAAAVLDPENPDRQILRPSAVLLSACLMMVLDIVIDPVALLGDRWFLGKIYDYPDGGFYFGVPLSNFAGWFFTGIAITGTFALFARFGVVSPLRWRKLSHRMVGTAFAIYSFIFLSNLGLTAWLGEWWLLAASSLFALMTIAICSQRLLWHSPKKRNPAATSIVAR